MPTALTAAPAPISGTFDERLRLLRDECVELWQATPCEPLTLGRRVGFFRQLANERAAVQLVDATAADIAHVPPEGPDQAWRARVRERLQTFGRDRLGWPHGYQRLLFGDAFYDASVAFARDARAFDPRLTLANLGQALRNVWIGNSLQMLLDRDVTLRPGLFAYSMLYPVTDNWLDDPEVSPARKQAFNARFGARLRGDAMPHPCDPLEPDAAVDRLVARVECEQPRDRFPEVYASLQAIHDAQSMSLDQHRNTQLTDARILALTFAKGGSSVLADLHLVTERATPSLERFAFGYGVFLQLLDDLQDVQADSAALHETIFTRAARQGPLDAATSRLARFIHAVLTDTRCFDGEAYHDRLDLIRRNCLALLVGSVAQAPGLFTRPFRRRMSAEWPVSFRGQRRLRRRAMRLVDRFAHVADDRVRAEDSGRSDSR